jgi:uncharacterized protein
MLVEFSVANHLSVRDPVTLSLLASSKVSEYRAQNLIALDRISLLRTAAIYGANASGKSNILASLVWMRWFVINSQKETQAGEPIVVKPFKLDVDYSAKPSHFEAIFLIGGVRYRYGFEVNAKMIVKEWLFRSIKRAESELLVRMGESIDVARGFGEGRDFVDNTRPNALFLSTVASLNGRLAGLIVRWFQRLVPVHGLNEQQYVAASVEMVKDSGMRDRFIDMIRKADLGIEDVLVKKADMTLPPDILELFSEEGKKRFVRDFSPVDGVSLRSVHTRFKDGRPLDTVEMDFNSEESDGTQKFFSLAGPVLHSLENGCVMIADELEAKLHPLLTRMIVRLFHSPVTNPRNAQLVFATHDANLLQYMQFRRDQIWFTEKTQQQATDLYSLAEIKLPKGKVRKDASYEKDYFKGRYGAVPYLGGFEKWFGGAEGADGEAR